MNCITLIGDIVESRQLQDRAEVQDRLVEVLSELNQAADELAITSPFTVTLGDEFQAVFSQADHLWRCLFKIECRLYPVQVRFSIGCGDLVTPINPDSAIGMDGSAFYRSREGINLLKQNGHLYRVGGLNKDTDMLIQNTLNLISEHRRKWNLNRLQIFYYLLAGYAVKDITPKVNLKGQSGVYKNIDDGVLIPIRNILQDLAQRMNRTLVAHE